MKKQRQFSDLVFLYAKNFVSCCMKKRVEKSKECPIGYQFGVVFPDDVCLLHYRDVKGNMTGVKFKFASIEEMLQNGWEVD